MIYLKCKNCEQSIPEIGGYDEVNGEIICQSCLFDKEESEN